MDKEMTDKLSLWVIQLTQITQTLHKQFTPKTFVTQTNKVMVDVPTPTDSLVTLFARV